MNLFINIVTAFRAIRKNKLRSVLTSVGIIIGISSVIAMFGIGSSAKLAVREQLFSYGKNAMLFEILCGKVITEEDIAKLRSYIPEIEYITPARYDEPRHDTTLHKYEGINHRSQVWFVGQDYFPIQGRTVVRGRIFTREEIKNHAKVCVIGETVALALFGQQEPVGEKITLNNGIYTVIGLLDEKGKAISGEDFDNLTIIPYTTGYKFFDRKDYISEVYVSSREAEDLKTVKRKMMDYFIYKYSLQNKPGCFEIVTSQDKLKMANDISNSLTILLAGVASISLVVGGIGIMNIMLVSVTERTREIGIRMAIGAKKRDILLQFLLEAIVLSCIGGAVGVILGLGLYYSVTVIVDWPFIFSYFSIVTSVFFSAAVGICFGYFPSKRAAGLNPIEALRHE
ncbi:MAG: ABC transporter permease [Spirochaetota bacterium]